MAPPVGLAAPALQPRYAIAALAAFAIVLVLGAANGAGGFRAPAVAGVAVALAAGAPAFVLRSRLAMALAVVAGAGVALAANGQPGDVAWFSVLVLVAWCAYTEGTAVGLACWGASLALFGAEWLWSGPSSGWANWAAGVSASVFAVLLLRRQLLLVEALRAAQASLAERSAADERNRIAREVHDVIAHSLTVSLLHISSARLAVQTDPGEAEHALAEAERLGRQSLDEVRATVGLLRTGAEGRIAPPVPSADRVRALVEQFRQAGAEVTLEVSGDLAALPATTGSALYRITQEALTNAAKHAPGAAIDVDVEVTSLRARLTVDSSGPPGHGQGLGLVGMSERAAVLGGTCQAGPGGRGWLVEASLPVPGGSLG